MIQALFRLCIAWMCVFWVSPVWAAQANGIVIVSSESSASYTETAGAVAAALERSGLSRSEISHSPATALNSSNTAGIAAPRLFITLGTEALRQVLVRDARVPVVAALIPRSGYERVLKDSALRSTSHVTALYLDQPFGRQLELARLVVPSLKRVGVLWGPTSQLQQGALGSALQSRGLQEVAGMVGGGESLFSGLKDALEGVDVLLAVADPMVYNSATVAHILLATYRARIPVLAFSPAYVKAGALMSLHTSPQQIGGQTAGMVRQVLQSGAVPSPQYPVEFSVTVNEHVARSLELKADASTLTERLRKGEVRP